MPTRSDVAILRPIWKLKLAPTTLIIKISIPPSTELNISLKIAFIGMENTLPITHNTIMQLIITKILEKSKFYHRTFFT